MGLSSVAGLQGVDPFEGRWLRPKGKVRHAQHVHE